MPRFGLATLNHSPLHGLPTQWEDHLDAAAQAGFDAIAPDIFWLRALEAEGVALETIAAGLADRDLACMEIAGIAIGNEEQTAEETREQVRFAEILSAEFINARIVEPINQDVIDQTLRCADAFRSVGTRIALEFSRGTKLSSIYGAQSFAEKVGQEGVGVTLDTWHFFLHPGGPDWSALAVLPAELLANVQLSDGMPYAEGEFGSATMNERRLPGEGGFDLKRCASMLKARGLDVPVVVEVLNAVEREKEIASFAERAMNASRRAWS